MAEAAPGAATDGLGDIEPGAARAARDAHGGWRRDWVPPGQQYPR